MSPERMDMILRLRQSGIYDLDVLRAMERLPRERFAGIADLQRAYAEKSLPLPCGQDLPAPFTLAAMVQALSCAPESRVLLIGAGSGYLAAMLAALCGQIYAVDRYQTLVDLAGRHLAELGINNVKLSRRDGYEGWAEVGPYDRIICCAQINDMPQAWREQIREGGRIVYGRGGQAMMRRGGQETPICGANLTPLQPGISLAL